MTAPARLAGANLGLPRVGGLVRDLGLASRHRGARRSETGAKSKRLEADNVMPANGSPNLVCGRQVMVRLGFLGEH